MKVLFSYIFVLFSVVLYAQTQPNDECEATIIVTDFEDVPEARVHITIKDQQGDFTKDVTADIQGIAKLNLKQGHKYDIRIAKGDTAFYFGRKEGKDVEVPIVGSYFSYELKYKIKIVESYQTITLLDVHFSTNSADVPANDKATIDKLYTDLKGNPIMKIELAAHTDDVGSDDANMLLSQKRADSVKDYLVSKGIDESRIIAKGYGEKKPVADNSTPEGRAANRRTEVRVIHQ